MFQTLHQILSLVGPMHGLNSDSKVVVAINLKLERR